MFLTLVPALVGLGLSFCGSYFMAMNLTPFGSAMARKLFVGSAQSRSRVVLFGTLGGLVTMSTGTVWLTSVSLARTGILQGQRAVLATPWASVGASALVILVSFNLQLAAAVFLLIAGRNIFFNVKLTDQSRYVVMSLFGAGLMFLGMEQVHAASEPLRNFLLYIGLLQPGSFWGATLLVGLCLTILTQSSSLTFAIAVALTRGGAFDLYTSLLLLAGATLGSGFSGIYRGRNGDSARRHVMYFQAAQKLTGAVFLLGLLFFCNRWIHAVFNDYVGGAAGLLSILYLGLQVFGALAVTLADKPLYALVNRLAPPTNEEGLSKPVFLVDEALGDPTLARYLADRELVRLIKRLPDMLDDTRSVVGGIGLSAAALAEAGDKLSEEIRRFLASLLDRQPDQATISKALRLQQTLANTLSLQAALTEFSVAAENASSGSVKSEVVERMTESLHLLLTLLVDASENDDVEDRRMSLLMFGDRGEVMEDIRGRLLAESKAAPPAVQEALFQTTFLFERILWLARDTLVIMMRDGGGVQAKVQQGAA